MRAPKASFQPLPVAYFGMAVGTLAFGQTWRVAERVWSLPDRVSLLLSAIGLTLWAALLPMRQVITR